MNVTTLPGVGRCDDCGDRALDVIEITLRPWAISETPRTVHLCQPCSEHLADLIAAALPRRESP
jgi:hypothetical protein